jgi:hypothetical protein
MAQSIKAVRLRERYEGAMNFIDQLARRLPAFTIVSLLAACEADSATREEGRSGQMGDEAESGGRSRKGEGRFTFAYPQARSGLHSQMRSDFKEAKLLEEITRELSETVRIPRDLQIRLETCDTINAWYDRREPAIVFCYDLLEHATGLFARRTSDREEIGKAVIGVFIFVLGHELGHALTHELQLTVTGREEDAVDQLAGLMLLSGSTADEGEGAVIAAGSYFAMASEGAPLAFADEHSLGPQRFYDAACLVYGSNPAKNGALVTRGLLPKERADRCPAEWAVINRSWRSMLKPHLVDEERFWSAKDANR